MEHAPNPPPATPQADTLAIHIVPPSEVDHAPDNHGRESDIDDLLASLPVEGQLQPGVCYRDDSGRLVCIDGNRRLAASRALGRPFQTIILKEKVSKAEAIKIRLSANVVRKGMTMKQIGQDVAEFIDMTGCSQREAAAKLGFREEIVSRALSLKLLTEDEEKRLVAAGLCWSGIALIAPLPTDLKAKAIAFVCSREPGEPPCRKEEVQRFIKRLKSGGKKEKRPKALRLSVDGLAVELALQDGDTVEAVAERLKTLAKGILRYKDLLPEALGGLSV